jgi:uncharacterized protein
VKCGPKFKRCLIIALVVLGAGVVVLNFAAYCQAYSMTHFVEHGATTGKPQDLSFGQKLKTILLGVNLPRPRSAMLPSRLGPGCRSLTIPGVNGVRLGAWYCPTSPDRPLVILFHGYHGDKSGTVNEAKVFQELGLPVLLVDLRGSGESSESYTTVGHDEAEDVASAVQYAATNLPHSKLVLYGISMGAAAVLRAVHACEVEPDAIIVEAVFDRMLTTVRHRFGAMKLPTFPGAELLVFWGGCQFGFNGFANNPVDFAPSVRCPILFLHGAIDPNARLEEARQVYDAVPGQKWFKEFPGVGHAPIVGRFRQQWKDDVSQFLTTAGILSPESDIKARAGR